MFERPSASGSCSTISPAQPIREERGPAVGKGRGRGVERVEPDEPLAREGVGEHRPVAGLEDVERQVGLGEEDRVEGEEGEDASHGSRPGAVRRSTSFRA